MEEDIEEGSKKSKYNSAVAQLFRIDALWKDCHTHSRSGAYAQWNSDLDKVWCELAGDLDKNSNQEKEYVKINKKIGEIYTKDNSGFTLTDKDSKKKMTTNYNNLIEKEIFLRRLQNELGKGTAYADEDEDSFE